MLDGLIGLYNGGEASIEVENVYNLSPIILIGFLMLLKTR